MERAAVDLIEKSRFSHVHLLINSSTYDHDFLISQASQITSMSIGVKRQKRVQLVVIIANDKFNLKSVNDVNEFYLIVMTRPLNVQELFKSIWERKNLLNVNLMMKNGSKIDLLTFFPFSEHECNNTKTIKIINEFSNDTWTSKGFFPSKISNFHSCTLRLGVPPAFPGTIHYKHKNGTIEFKGSDIKIVRELELRLKFKNDILKCNYWGDVYLNGSSDDCLGELLKKRIDYVSGWYFLAPLKATFLDNIQPYFFVPFVMVVPPGKFFFNNFNEINWLIL